jgi:hypothetical protein
MQSRIEHFQQYLPDGRKISEVPMAERGQYWSEANTIISEFQYVINFYEESRKIVEEAEKK